jgi:hypothetical protein
MARKRSEDFPSGRFHFFLAAVDIRNNKAARPHRNTGHGQRLLSPRLEEDTGQKTTPAHNPRHRKLPQHRTGTAGVPARNSFIPP